MVSPCGVKTRDHLGGRVALKAGIVLFSKSPPAPSFHDHFRHGKSVHKLLPNFGFKIGVYWDPEILTGWKSWGSNSKRHATSKPPIAQPEKGYRPPQNGTPIICWTTPSSLRVICWGFLTETKWHFLGRCLVGAFGPESTGKNRLSSNCTVAKPYMKCVHRSFDPEIPELCRGVASWEIKGQKGTLILGEPASSFMLTPN